MNYQFFNFVGWITNPFILMFLAVFTGLLFGKIKFGRFNFGVSGTLFTGIIIGWIITKYANGFSESSIGYSSAQSMLSVGVIPKNFFSLFLILFVAAVGLLAAKDMNVVIKKYGAKFILLGIVITCISAGATYAMTLLSEDSDPYEVAGVYTGALTSSPGLAAAIETATDHATEKIESFNEMNDNEKKKIAKELGIATEVSTESDFQLTTEQKKEFIKNAEAGIGTGHAIGYPFGVLIVILAVNFFPNIFRIDVEKERELYRAEMAAARKSANIKEINTVSFDLIAFTVACLFGYTIGQITIPLGLLGDFSLGSTGGVLIGSLVLGYIGKIGSLHFRMDSKILSVVRQLSLAFFLGIVGLRYGFTVINSVVSSTAGAYLALVSVVVGVVGMLIGFFIGRYVFKLNWLMLSGAICGGMTSTPGLGAAIEAAGTDEPAAGYGATYPFALLGMVLFTIILHKLPM
ncbi:hypothetical protein [Anaeromonas frigoriresistens]|uniref:aspartate-alanine antiporter-like transporter n=1 Tax=Anaeromonas frigoriresistens TaxID=2683708 RepID=UPI003315FA14